MESEELEVPNGAAERGGQKGHRGDSGHKLDSVSSISTSSASPPASPSKRSPTFNSYKGKSNSYYPHGNEVNGDGKDYLESEPVSPPHKSPLSGISAPKIPNIKIKKQYSKIYRIKTKILQNLGKADKTTDEVFDDYEVNFNKQQLNANRLHKEISNYLRCARALHGASKALFETLSEVYEPEWVGHDLIYAQAQNSDMLWTDFCHKIQDQTLVPLTSYTQEFPELRKKIDKRGRKLVDYDSQRHQLENLQRSARRDEYKIARVKDQLENARSTYETLNKELYDELPSIFDQRIPNTANSLTTLFAAEGTFMQESSKISKELEFIAEKLGKECNRGTYNTKRGYPPKAPRPITVSGGSPQSPRNATSPTTWFEVTDAVQEKQRGLNESLSKDAVETSGEEKRGDKEEEEKKTINVEIEMEEDIKKELNNATKTNDDDDDIFEEILNDDEITSSPSPVTPPRTPPPPILPQGPPPDSPKLSSTSDVPSQTPRKSKDENRPTISGPLTAGREETGRPYEEIEFEDKKVNGTAPKINGEVNTQIPLGATTEGLPPGVLYKVKATYKYIKEDVDELGFDIGEVIQVVEYEDPEEQEEGWLCGVKESSSEKGLFPANFTRPL